jgi:hypothetical protein
MQCPRKLRSQGHMNQLKGVILAADIPLTVMNRVKQLSAHFTGSPTGMAALERQLPDDVVVTMAIRSPLCKARKGGFKDARFVHRCVTICL